MGITWDAATPDHLNKIDSHIENMGDSQKSTAQVMNTLAEINQGETMRAIKEYHDTQVAPRINAILEEFRSFVQATRVRHTAALNQDQENARIS